MGEQETLEQMVRERIAVAYCTPHDCAFQGGDAREGPKGTGEPGSCPVLWIVHDLVGIMVEFRDRPMQQAAPIIHQFLVEQQFVDENGDNVIDTSQQDEVDQHVQRVVGILEDIRRQMSDQGIWCDQAPAPIMFG